MADETRTPKPVREMRDVWITADEAPDWMRHSTDEGAQRMQQDESQQRLVEQMGVRVDDDYVLDDEIAEDERMIINMGPQHPSTHGVMRLQIELEGEIVRRVKPIIGYLHTGMEKTGENLMYMQGGTNVTRMDYVAPLFNELVFALATEKLLGVEIPPRAQAIRVLMTELNRTASHLVSLATQGMDVGALSMMLYGFRERELILAFFEKTTGLRMNHNYIRPGGVAADLPDGWEEDVAEIVEKVPVGVADYEDLLKSNPIWEGRTRGVGRDFRRGMPGLRDHRTTAPGHRRRFGSPQDPAVLGDRSVRLRCRRRLERRCLRPLPHPDPGDPPIAPHRAAGGKPDAGRRLPG